MSRKVFISYKYGDTLVQGANTTCRNYVDAIQERIEDTHIFKGEEDGNDLSNFAESTIETKLKKKIRDSSVTIVLISKGMVENKGEREQWIPWEIKYSLLKTTVDGRTSHPNGLLAVVIPDEYGSYDYCMKVLACGRCTSHETDWLFEIIKNNMFNRKEPKTTNCYSGLHSGPTHTGDDHSYVYPVRWDNFIANPSQYIEHAASLMDRIEEFEVQKLIKKTWILNPSKN